jgi:hypothetical protein
MVVNTDHLDHIIDFSDKNRQLTDIPKSRVKNKTQKGRQNKGNDLVIGYR